MPFKFWINTKAWCFWCAWKWRFVASSDVNFNYLCMSFVCAYCSTSMYILINLVLIYGINFTFIKSSIMNKSENDSSWFKTVVDQLGFIFKIYDLLYIDFVQELMLAHFQLFHCLIVGWVDNNLPHVLWQYIFDVIILVSQNN